MSASTRNSPPAAQVELAGIFDTQPDTARKIAAKYNARIFNSVAEAAARRRRIEHCHSPTTPHFDLAKLLLQQGKHVLVEKPMTDNTAQAAELIQIAQQKIASCKSAMSSGSTRFHLSPTSRHRAEVHRVPSPVALPCPLDRHRRRARFDDPRSGRGAGVCEIAGNKRGRRGHSRFKQERGTSPTRACVFANGCVANLTASRVFPERMRKIRVISGPTNPCYISLDYPRAGGIYFTPRPRRRAGKFTAEKNHGRQARHRQGLDHRPASFAGKKIVREPVPIAKDEPLKLELQHSSNASARSKPLWSAANPPNARWTGL